MDTSDKKKSFSTPLNSQTPGSSSGEGKSHSAQPGGQQTKASTTAAQQPPPPPTPPNQQVIYPIAPGQIPPSPITPGQQVLTPTIPGQQIFPATSPGKVTFRPTLEGGQQSPIPVVILQQAPQPNVVRQQLPSPIPPGHVAYYPPPTGQRMPLVVLPAPQVMPPTIPGQVPYLGQPITVPTPPGLKVTYSMLPGQLLPHQILPGSPISPLPAPSIPSPPSPPIPPRPKSPPRPLTPQEIAAAQKERVRLLYYHVMAIVLAATLLCNAIAWFIVYTIGAVTTTKDDTKIQIIIAVAFAFSMLINFSGLVCTSCHPDGTSTYMVFLFVDGGWMIAVIALASVYQFVPTAVVSSIVIVVIIVQCYVIQEEAECCECCT